MLPRQNNIRDSNKYPDFRLFQLLGLFTLKFSNFLLTPLTLGHRKPKFLSKS